jgi:hypothetical protein
MASKNLSQRLVVALTSKAKAEKLLSCIADRSELPADVKASLETGLADAKIGREVSNSVDTGATLTKKAKDCLTVMLADKKAAEELIKLIED